VGRPVTAAVRAAVLASGAAVVLLAVLAVAAFTAPHGGQPAPAPGPAPVATRHPRQNRTCPYCRGWFNTERDQAAHERTCDQRPEDDE